MGWELLALDWLARAAIGGLVFLVLGAAAVRLCRQPADRVRVTVLALVGAVLVPWAALLPGVPRWSVAVLPAAPAADAGPAAATPPEPVASTEPGPATRPVPPPEQP